MLFPSTTLSSRTQYAIAKAIATFNIFFIMSIALITTQKRNFKMETLWMCKSLTFSHFNRHFSNFIQFF